MLVQLVAHVAVARTRFHSPAAFAAARYFNPCLDESFRGPDDGGALHAGDRLPVPSCEQEVLARPARLSPVLSMPVRFYASGFNEPEKRRPGVGLFRQRLAHNAGQILTEREAQAMAEAHRPQDSSVFQSVDKATADAEHVGNFSVAQEPVGLAGGVVEQRCVHKHAKSSISHKHGRRQLHG